MQLGSNERPFDYQQFEWSFMILRPVVPE